MNSEPTDKLGRPLATREIRVMAHMLAVIERDSQVTQRSLSKELGIALGLANAYLKRCIHKGLVKVRQAPLNRYTYYLTPSGFAEKSRLTAQYLSDSFRLFHDARVQYSDIFQSCLRRSWFKVALMGRSELAEIAILSAVDHAVRIICVVDPHSESSCAGRSIVANVAAASRLADGLDALVVSDLRNPQSVFDSAVQQAIEIGLSDERILAPALLNISRVPLWSQRETHE